MNSPVSPAGLSRAAFATLGLLWFGAALVSCSPGTAGSDGIRVSSTGPATLPAGDDLGSPPILGSEANPFRGTGSAGFVERLREVPAPGDFE